MFIQYSCHDMTGEVCTELASFYGIRYNRNGFAVLSTEHAAHDYLLPMSVDSYKKFLDKLTGLINTDAKVIKISRGMIYRVRRGAMLPLDDKRSNEYDLEV
ncbi:MAG: hypothetical protein K6G83_00175 [Lachnospiraceae bacterium]|nr:hypothetical protein [Lachnospiraceae bacterium]